MAKGKKGTVLRVPKDSVLQEFGISKSATSALTRRICVPVDINNEIAIHSAVLKMRSSAFEDNSATSKKVDKKLEKTLSKLATLEGASTEKLSELKKSKEKYQNTNKLAHELEQEKQRKEAQRRRRISLSEIQGSEQTIEAKNIYSTEVSNVAVNTVKPAKVKKENNIADSGIKMSDEIKRLRISITSGKSSANSGASLKNAQYTSPSSQFFAKKLG